MQRDQVAEPLEPDYNVAPTKPVYAVITRGERAEPEAEPCPRAAGGALGAGAVLGQGRLDRQPPDQRPGGDRGEKPAFRRAFARRRCLLPADGYYEWQAGRDEAARSSRTTSTAPTAARWPSPASTSSGGTSAVPDDDPDAWLWTATIITTSAPDELGRIHDRMPMVIDPGSWADWLDPASGDAADLRSLLVPAASAG